MGRAFGDSWLFLFCPLRLRRNGTWLRQLMAVFVCPLRLRRNGTWLRQLMAPFCLSPVGFAAHEMPLRGLMARAPHETKHSTGTQGPSPQRTLGSMAACPLFPAKAMERRLTPVGRADGSRPTSTTGPRKPRAPLARASPAGRSGRPAGAATRREAISALKRSIAVPRHNSPTRYILLRRVGGGIMLLRSITKHVSDQNWVAVALDFFIVVAGVYIGIQLGNWNDARGNKQATISALERLNGEINVNIDTADGVIVQIDASASIRADALDALSTCDSSDTALKSIKDAATSMTEDILPSFVNNVARDLARQNQYTQFLSDEFLAELNIYDGHITDEVEQLHMNFGLMWDQHIINNPFVSVNLQNDDTLNSPFSFTQPISALCKDNVFIRQFYMTNVWHESAKLRLNRFKDRSESFRQALQTELVKIR